MDVALVDSMVSALEIINIIYLCTGRVPSRIGNRYEAIYPYDSFKAKDGHVIIACGNNKLFELLVGVMNMPELLENPHFADNNERVLNHAELKPIIEEWLKDKTIDETVDMLFGRGHPGGAHQHHRPRGGRPAHRRRPRNVCRAGAPQGGQNEGDGQPD